MRNRDTYDDTCSFKAMCLFGNNFLVSRILARFENKNSFRKQQKTKNVVSDVVRRWVKVTGAKQLRTCSLAANCISWIKVSFCWGWMHDVYGWQVFTINIKQKSKYELLFKILLDIWVSIYFLWTICSQLHKSRYH